uniref:H15 domain-containing protein n=1 Tax=Naja naja TaxID=35670 RepID=A0A8C6VFE5_NAJNA
MESNKFPETPTIDITIDFSETEDAEGGLDDQVIPGPSTAADAQEPLLRGGKNMSRKKATLHPKRQLNQSRASAPKPPTSSLSLLIYSAIANCQKKSGISMQALKKIVTKTGYDMDKKKQYFLKALKNMVAKGQIWQLKGTGATGSFTINPNTGKKKAPPKKGKGQKTEVSAKNKKRSATSKKHREAAKKQVKAGVKKTCKRSKTSSGQAGPSQVKV